HAGLAEGDGLLEGQHKTSVPSGRWTAKMTQMDGVTDLLARLERYYDEAPRAGADVEEYGPFTVFVSRGGWPYYARPRLGLAEEITADQVLSVLDRLHELGQPRSIEWVHENTPSLRPAALA